MSDQCGAGPQSTADAACRLAYITAYRVAYFAASVYQQTRLRWVAAGGPTATSTAVGATGAVARAVLNTIIPGSRPPAGPS